MSRNGLQTRGMTLAGRRGLPLKWEWVYDPNGARISMCPRPWLDGWWHRTLVRRCRVCNQELRPVSHGDVCEHCRDGDPTPAPRTARPAARP